MIRIFIFLALVLGLGFLFSWVADRPGDVVLDWQGTQYETNLMVALTILVAIIAAILFVWSVLRGIVTSPAIMSRFFKNRRRERGYQALSKGLIAANSGDSEHARRLTIESGKLLSDEPLVALLDAQTSLLEGDRENARKQYSKMLENDSTKLLALRGFYVEAEREGAGEAARHYANEAVKMESTLPWAGNAVLGFQTVDGEWEQALRTLEANRSAGLVDKDLAKKQRAVLLTAQAFAEEPSDPTRAAKLAQQAHGLDGELVPAAIIGSRAYTRLGDIRKANKLIEAVWKKSPHPELADAYIHVRSGDSVSDRLKRANHLAGLKSGHAEGNMAIALAAIDAQDWALSRKAMQPVLISSLSERACLIMAEIEEGEHGDKGRMRDWLARAVRAPRDPAWTADGYVSEKWLPISPVSGEIGAFQWRLPVEQLGAPAEAIDIDELTKPLVLEPEEIKAPDDISDKVETAEVPDADEAELVEAINNADQKKETEAETDVDEVEGVVPLETQSAFPLKRRPDDPGVRKEGSEEKAFKFF
ncbi:MAG: heme biosynthesis HemY N-terminal domain-containing protein [Rhizobiaceae bacterium]